MTKHIACRMEKKKSDEMYNNDKDVDNDDGRMEWMTKDEEKLFLFVLYKNVNFSFCVPHLNLEWWGWGEKISFLGIEENVEVWRAFLGILF